MLIKSFVTVAVTTSFRNKNWESKGNDTDSKFWNQGKVPRFGQIRRLRSYYTQFTRTQLASHRITTLV